MTFKEYIEKRTKMMLCDDCNADIRAIKEYNYILKDEIWNKMADKSQELCVGCAEKRLGRELGPEDFDWKWPINFDDAPRSQRLLDRMFKGQ